MQVIAVQKTWNAYDNPQMLEFSQLLYIKLQLMKKPEIMLNLMKKPEFRFKPEDWHLCVLWEVLMITIFYTEEKHFSWLSSIFVTSLNWTCNFWHGHLRFKQYYTRFKQYYTRFSHVSLNDSFSGAMLWLLQVRVPVW